MNVFRILLLVLMLGTIGLADEEKVEMAVLRTPVGVRFGLIGEKPSAPAPTLLVIGLSLEEMQRSPIYTNVARRLIPHGFIGVVLDPPCHGEDARPGEPKDLDGWRYRLDHGEPFIKPFSDKARAVLDHLVEQRYTDPKALAVFGNSRGGFLAFHLAAVEPRIRFIGAIAPVAKLMAVREFAGSPREQDAEKLSLVHLTPHLAGRPVWITIPNHDTRVDTDEAIAFTRALVRAAVEKNPGDDRQIIPVDLLVVPAPGHASTVTDHERLVQWFLEQFKGRSQP